MTTELRESSGFAAPPHTVVPFIANTLDRVVGPEQSTALPPVGGARIMSYGNSLRTESMHMLADDVRGMAVLADGNGQAFAGELAARVFHRAMSGTKPGKLVNSYDALHAVTRAHRLVDESLQHAQATLGVEQSDTAASFAGFQLLYGGRLAFIRNDASLDLFVVDPGTRCRKQSGYESQGGGYRNVIQLQPGPNVLVLTANNAKTTDIAQCVANEDIDPADPQAASVIASRLVADPGADSGVVVLVVHVDERVDARPAWRRRLDPVRASTAMCAIAARHSGLRRRRFYEQPTPRGKVGRAVGRSIDVAASLTGLYLLYNVGRSALSWFGYAPPAQAKSVDDMRVLADALLPSPHPNQPITLELPVDSSAQPPTTAETQLYNTLRTALAVDTSTGQSPARASNLSDWARNDISQIARQEGLTEADIQTLQTDEHLVSAVVDGYRQDNSAIAADGLLNEGDAYHTATGRQTAGSAVQTFKDLHHPTPPTLPHAEQPLVLQPIEPHITPVNSNPNYVWHIVAGIGAAGIAVAGMQAWRHRHSAAEQFALEQKGQARTHNKKKRRNMRRLTTTSTPNTRPLPPKKTNRSPHFRALPPAKTRPIEVPRQLIPDGLSEWT